MSSKESSKAESAKKRARESDALASIDVNKRTKDLSKKLLSLCEEFPEVKYIARSEKSLMQVVKLHRDVMIQHAEEKSAKKCKVMLHKGESAPLYSLPDEVLVNCLSYVGKGHYALVGLASKTLNEAYKFEFGQETAYLEMATSVKLVNHCFDNLCKLQKQKEDMLRAVAVNGNLNILRALVKDGYDFSPFIEMKKETIYQCGDGNYITSDDFEPGICEDDFEYEEEIYYADDGDRVKFSRIVEKGHLHVLKYLHEELNYHEGLQRYVKPAIEHGQLEILNWLESIGCLKSNHKMFTYFHDLHQMNYQPFAFCDEAVRCGNVQALQWLLGHKYEFGENSPVMQYAICSNSLEMIRFCHDMGHDISLFGVDAIIKETRNVEVYRLLHEVGFQFRGEITDWIDDKRYWGSAHLAISKQWHQKRLDIIKFLRSISVPWDDGIMREIVEYGTLEMIQFAHRDGCSWTGIGDEYKSLLYYGERTWSVDKLKYLVSNGCKFDFDHFLDPYKQKLIKFLCKTKELVLLEFFVGENSSFDNGLFKYFSEHSQVELWFEGLSYLLQNGKDVRLSPSDLEE